MSFRDAPKARTQNPEACTEPRSGFRVRAQVRAPRN